MKNDNPFRLDGDVALVTGGCTGFGKAITKALAEAGAKVAVVGRGKDPPDNAAAEHPGRVLGYTQVVTKPDGVPSLVTRMEGCSESYIYRKTILSLSIGPISAPAVYAFPNVWGFFTWPLIITTTMNKYTTGLGLAMFQNQFFIEDTRVPAGATVTALPLLLVCFRVPAPHHRRDRLDGTQRNIARSHAVARAGSASPDAGHSSVHHAGG